MNKSKRITSYDVAQAAGVSQSAVSRAFTKGASISEGKKAHIMKVASELGYVVNSLARAITTKRTDVVGIILDLRNLRYSRILQALGKLFPEHELQMMLFPVSIDTEVDAAIDQLIRYQADGAIIYRPLTASQLARCRNANIRLTAFSFEQKVDDVAYVVCDHQAGAKTIAKKLIKAGHTKLAFIAGSSTDPTSDKRLKGFRNYIKRELTYNIPVEFAGGWSYEDGKRLAYKLLTEHPDIDAICCGNDEIAMGAMDAVRYDLGKEIPDDLSVIGFDDNNCAGRLPYGITVMDLPIDEMAASIVSILKHQIDGGVNLFDTIKIDPIFVERSSATVW